MPPAAPSHPMMSQSEGAASKITLNMTNPIHPTRLACICLLTTATALGQAGSPASEHGDSFDLTVGSTGLSFGNGQDMNGIRFAWRDGHFIRVNGLNLSAWTPYDTPSGEVNGISFGIVGPAAQQMRGLSIGLGGVLAQNSMEGVNIGGLGLVSEGVITGINVAGLGLVAQGSISGISIGGLGLVGQRDMTGLNLAGLGVIQQGTATGINFGGLGVVSQGSLIGINSAVLGLVAQQQMMGVNIGGLGTVAQSDIFGLTIGGLGLVTQGQLAGCSVGGLGTVAQGSIRGLSVGGLGLVSQGAITGLNVAGLGCVAREKITGVSVTLGMVRSEQGITGITFGGYRLTAPVITGANLSIAWTESAELAGFTVAAYNRTFGTQRGLVIGLFNHTESLLGVQIGLVNYVENNPSWARILPFINANL